MKKVFISVPMKDRTKENIEKSIEKIKEYGKLVIDDEVEFINTIVEEKPPYKNNNQAVWYLGKSIEILSQCDAILVPEDTWNFNGCDIEKSICYKYGIEVIEYKLQHFCKDLYESSKKLCEYSIKEAEE